MTGRHEASYEQTEILLNREGDEKVVEWSKYQIRVRHKIRVVEKGLSVS